MSVWNTASERTATRNLTLTLVYEPIPREPFRFRYGPTMWEPRGRAASVASRRRAVSHTGGGRPPRWLANADGVGPGLGRHGGPHPARVSVGDPAASRRAIRRL